MIGGPQPSGGMEGLKSQLRQGADATTGGENGVDKETDQATDGDDKGTCNIVIHYIRIIPIETNNTIWVT